MVEKSRVDKVGELGGGMDGMIDRDDEDNIYYYYYYYTKRAYNLYAYYTRMLAAAVAATACGCNI